MSADHETERDRLFQTFELFEFGVEMMAAKFRREHPDASPAQIEGMVNDWLAVRPGAEDGDGDGSPADLCEISMNAVERALRDFLAVRPSEMAIALVGGMAVSVRVEPRFTRDLDFAVAVSNDDEATQCVFRLRQIGYEIVSVLEQTSPPRLSTIRLRRAGQGPIVDLLFAICGIEPEIVQAAQPLEIGAGIVVDVAQVGHLIAMKLVSRGFSRGRDLRAGIAELREL